MNEDFSDIPCPDYFFITLDLIFGDFDEKFRGGRVSGQTLRLTLGVRGGLTFVNKKCFLRLP